MMFVLLGAFTTIVLAAGSVNGVVGDVKYIKCEVCNELSDALHVAVVGMRSGLGKRPLDEGKVHALVESACSPENDEGAWLRHLDLVEDGPRLRVERQAGDGPCGKECATAALACVALLEEGWENELGEALYAGTRDAAALRETVCRELSSSCAKKPPKLPSKRPAGPRFRAYTEEERAERETHESPAPGMLSEHELDYSLGLTDEAPPERIAVGFQGGSAGAGLSGGGEALAALAHAAAFGAA